MSYDTTKDVDVRWGGDSVGGYCLWLYHNDITIGYVDNGGVSRCIDGRYSIETLPSKSFKVIKNY